MAKEKSDRICFVIAPIGAEGSDVRIRSDQILKHIVGPAAKDCGYDPIRADQISEPGLITSQVIQHVVEDALVIADLTGRNPNVFYELALRHAVKKPVVQIIHATESIPFDVAASRTVHVDHHDLDSAAKAREEIGRQIRAVEKNPTEVDTPISVAIELQSLRQSDNPLEKSNAEIISMLQEIRVGLVAIREEPRSSRVHPGMVEEMVMFFRRLSHELEALTAGEKQPTVEQLQNLRQHLHRSERLLHMIAMETGMPPSLFDRRMTRHRVQEEPQVKPE